MVHVLRLREFEAESWARRQQRDEPPGAGNSEFRSEEEFAGLPREHIVPLTLHSKLPKETPSAMEGYDLDTSNPACHLPTNVQATPRRRCWGHYPRTGGIVGTEIAILKVG
jgi:hypothetical protein